MEPFSKKIYSIRDKAILDIITNKKNPLVTSKTDKLNLENKTMVRDLVRKNILIQPNKIDKISRAYQLWKKNNWLSTFYFHLVSRDFPYLDYAKASQRFKDADLMSKYREINKPPNIYKQYKNSRKYNLINIKNHSFNLKYSDNPRKPFLDHLDLSALLFLTFGETGHMTFPVQGKVLLKTSPSGGARHPSEGYVFVLKNTMSVPKGVYHYSVKNNCLEQIESKFSIDKAKNLFYKLNHRKDFDPHLIILITSVFERNMWRYREPRTFRVIFFDVGHLITTIKVITRSMGFEILINHGFNDKKITNLLKLNPAEEMPIHCALIGKGK